MSIEKSLERIADAIELYVSGVKTVAVDPTQPGKDQTVTPAGKKPPAKKKAAKKKTASTKEYTEDDLRVCFQEYVGRKGNEEGTSDLKDLIKKYGAAKIGDIKPENFAEIIEEVQSWE